MKSRLLIDEEFRLSELYKYNILDTENEDIYDQITELVAHICETPIALISFIDEKREWFKSHFGITDIEKPRGWAFCEEMKLQQGVFEVKDSLNGEYIEEVPCLANGDQVRFYAGVPIINAADQHIGTLCVIDHKPSSLSAEQKMQLTLLGKQVLYLLELRKSHAVQAALQHQSIVDVEELAQKNKQFEQFVYIVSHDLKAPLITISAFAHKLSKELECYTSDKQKHRFTRIEENISHIGHLLTELVDLSRVMRQVIEKEPVSTELLIREQWQKLKSDDVNLIINESLDTLFANKTLFSRCVVNIISYIIHNKAPDNTLNIMVYTKNYGAHISLIIMSNGLKMSKEDQERAFSIFEQVEQQKKTGMGLCIVKAAMEKHAGEIILTSTLDESTQFELIFPIEKQFKQ